MSEPFTTPIDATTRCCAVFGHPIKHSASPAMQNAGIAALGLNWRYHAFEVHPENLHEAIAGAKAMKFIGLNLTVPHKLLAMDLVDELDESAKSLGAVNTIAFETRSDKREWVCFGQVPADQITEIRSRGFNTDGDAIIQSIKEEFEWPEEGLRGATILLLGAGGAARAAALKLASEGVSTIFANRTLEKAFGIAEEVRQRFPDVEVKISIPANPDNHTESKQLAEEISRRYPETKILVGYPQDPVSLVINATSLGLKPTDALPINEDWLRSRRPKRVYDMIYRPAETPLLRAAKAASETIGGGSACRTANGLGMLLHQGAKALEIWSGKPAPIEIMRRALERNIYG